MNIDVLSSLAAPGLSSVLRFAFLANCALATILIWRYSSAARRVKNAAVIAGMLHFCCSVTIDIALVDAGIYAYAFNKGLYFGVPVDLHLAWAALWGSGYCLLWHTLERPVWRLAFFCAVLGLTFGADLAAVSLGEILLTSSRTWMIADLACLIILPVVSLSLFHLVCHNRALLFRAVLYAGMYCFVFYFFIPTLILQMAGRLSQKSFNLPLLPLPWCLLIVGASLPGLWAAIDFARKGQGTPLPLDETQQLVVTGPYKFVRNPMQLSGVLVALILAAAFDSIYLWIYAVDLIIILELLRPWEERNLLRRFGMAYAEYAARTRRWLPKVPAATAKQVVTADPTSRNAEH
jgi:protein-S-isoprenylcysteine O-methyltransferase Ste14